MKDCKHIFHYVIIFLLLMIIFINSIIQKQKSINDLVIWENIPKISDELNIPNILFQTHHTKSEIPQYIFDNINTYASGYKYVLLDDKDALIFLNKYFSKCVVQKFKYLPKGPHKADLLRYCLLYIYGGVYMDIKIILIKKLDDIFINKTYFYSVIGHDNIQIFQGIIASPPRNKLFLELVCFIINTSYFSTLTNYHIFVKDLYNRLLRDCNNTPLHSGLNIGNLYKYYLFDERCSTETSNTCTKLDRYGFCCSVYDKNDKIFINRDPNYPWGKVNTIIQKPFRFFRNNIKKLFLKCKI